MAFQRFDVKFDVMKEKLPGLAANAKGRFPGLAAAARERIPELAKTAKEKLPDLAGTAKEKLPDLAETAKEKLPNILTRDSETKVYSGLEDLPSGFAGDAITEGCLLLEGGAFRGMYSQGVCDALMEAGINFRTTAGVSAGALTGVGYVAGQIGWSARINLTYRHNSNYIGLDAMKNDHGITGFSFLFSEAMEENPLNEERFYDPLRRFVCQATNLQTGKPAYFEKGKCEDIFRAVQASATVPFLSEPVMIDDIPYLDGGISYNIPYHWAKWERFDKMVVVKTRDRSYRAEETTHPNIDRLFYRDYPELLKAMEFNSIRYNCLLDEIDADEAAGHVFVVAPEEPIDIGRFEGDMEKLGDLYWTGYNEMKTKIPALKEYLDR